MKALQHVCGAAAAAMALMAAAPANAEPQRGTSVHLAAATSQSTAVHKPMNAVKITTPRKKKRCF